MYDIFAKRIIQPTPFRVVEGETLLERALKALEKVRGGECEGRKTCVERLKWFQSSNADLSFNAFISPSPVLIHTDLVGFESYMPGTPLHPFEPQPKLVNYQRRQS